jgi:hypothetical protein
VIELLGILHSGFIEIFFVRMEISLMSIRGLHADTGVFGDISKRTTPLDNSLAFDM